MANYSTDDDLLEVRQDILSLGVSDWSTQHAEAKLLIDRDIEINWYRDAALQRGISPDEAPFDADLILIPNQLKRLSVYKVLELAYLYLEHQYESDPLMSKTNRFKQLYNDEFKAVTTKGLSYDWDASGEIGADESNQRSPRVLRRV